MPTLDPSVLDGPLKAAAPGVIDLAVEDSSVHRVSQLAHRGEVLEAARQAEALLADRVYDMRIIGYFLFGLFLERGIGYLPDLFRRIRDLLGDDFAALGPNRKKARVVDAVMLWLFQSIDARIRFHAEFRDDTWQAWLAAAKPALSMSIADAAAEVQIAANARLEDPQCIAALARVQRWASSDLSRALNRGQTGRVAAIELTAEEPRALDRGQTGRVAAIELATEEPRAPARGQTGRVAAIELAAEDPPTPTPTPTPTPAPAPAPARPTRTTLVGTGRASAAVRAPQPEPWGNSPAMTALLDKMRAFETLVGRGDFAKAAIVASDVRHLMETFDPVTYLPQLFADYLKALYRANAEMEPYWQMDGTPAWHALEKLYRASLDAFLDE